MIQIPEFKPGDIVIRLQPKYVTPWSDLLGWGIAFFTTAWWKGEPRSRTGHAEMVYDAKRTISMQPPKVKLRPMPVKSVAIFRLINKPEGFDKAFRIYVQNTWDHRYDFVKFAMFLLDWIFHTSWFSGHVRNKARDVCSEFVAQFYESAVGVQCSVTSAESTVPDDIIDYCEMHPDIFRCIYRQDPA